MLFVRLQNYRFSQIRYTVSAIFILSSFHFSSIKSSLATPRCCMERLSRNLYLNQTRTGCLSTRCAMPLCPIMPEEAGLYPIDNRIGYFVTTYEFVSQISAAGHPHGYGSALLCIYRYLTHPQHSSLGISALTRLDNRASVSTI